MSKGIEYEIKVMQAYQSGDLIEFLGVDGDWHPATMPTWNWVDFNYRIKPDPEITSEKLVSDILSYVKICDHYDLARCHRMVTGSDIIFKKEKFVKE
jgi:hypothetical protein